MAQNYTRQSSFSDGDTITASLFNNEYNQLVNAFTYSSTDVDATGHRHDGTSGQGGNIYRIGDLNFLNKIEADSVNNRWGFFVEVSSTAVEQIRIQDGAILPVTTNDIDLGSVTLQFKDGYFDGTINADSLVLSSGSTVTAVLDEDNFVSDSATALATQQSIKAYVDAQVTAQDLDFQGDTGGALSIDLDSETLTIAGGTGIDTSGATNTLTVSIDSTVTTLTGTQTLTNKTINADNNTVSNLEVDNLKTGVLDTDISSVAGTHTTLPSALAVKTYVDAQVTAQDLDIVGDTGTDSIDLDSETITFTGGTGITSVVTAGTVTHNIDSTVATLTGTQTLTNKTLTSPDINGGTIDNAIIGGTTAAAGSFTNITVSGTVDGRDVAADGTKLDGIEALADVTDTANVTAAGALMDSELTNITAVKALNQGVATTDSPSFAGLTATTADINAGTIDGTVIGGSTAAAITGTTITGTSFVSSGDMTFGDSDKAIFGAGSDLQIYHDGSHSYVKDNGTGNLRLQGATTIQITDPSFTSYSAQFDPTGAATFYYNNAEKLATTATGIDVTGTVTADGLTVDGKAEVNGVGSTTGIQLDNGAQTHKWYLVDNFTNRWDIGTSSLGAIYNFGSNNGARNHLQITTGGDISFYEDTGTTAKFFWDASAESLGIGTSSPSQDLHIREDSGDCNLLLDSANGASQIFFGDDESVNIGNIRYDHASNYMRFSTNSAERLRIDSSGNVGIGTSSPTAELHIKGAQPADAFDSQLFVDTTDTTGTIDYGSKISFGYHDGVSSRAGPYILAAKENNTSGNYASYMSFATRPNSENPTEAMRIDSSGNLGLGVTPSDWSSASRPVFQLPNGAALFSRSGTTFLSQNFFYNSSDIGTYIANGFATLYNQVSGKHQWFNAPSGTAGNTAALTQAMTLDASGNLLVGKSATAFGTAGIEARAGGTLWATASETNAASFNRLSTDGEIAYFNKDGTTVGSIGAYAGHLSLGNTDTGLLFNDTIKSIYAFNVSTLANNDNAIDLGWASVRFDDIYATNGTIQTSDRNEKQDIEVLSEAEQRVAVAAKGLLRKFRWKDSVEDKGDDARIHFGIIAQDLQAAFEAEGLDAGRYAMFISSTWTDEETGEERSRMGVRYSELLAFIIAAI
jgi:hypothetical protein